MSGFVCTHGVSRNMLCPLCDEMIRACPNCKELRSDLKDAREDEKAASDIAEHLGQRVNDLIAEKEAMDLTFGKDRNELENALDAALKENAQLRVINNRCRMELYEPESPEGQFCLSEIDKLEATNARQLEQLKMYEVELSKHDNPFKVKSEYPDTDGGKK